MNQQEKFSKVLIKVLDVNDDKIRWVHLCYADTELYNQYMAEKCHDTNTFAMTLARWAAEDFNVDLAMASTKDIYILRGLVKDFYKRAYPDLFMDSPTDRQGWMRVWITKKMKEELKIYGK